MLRAFLSRWLPSTSADVASRRVVVESVPPLSFGHSRAWPSRLGEWLAASGWRVAGIELPSSLGRRARRRALVAARLDFAEALADVDTDAAADMLDQVAAKRSLHELWHCRAEVFGRVAQRHGQTEAARRLAAIDRHFPSRTRRAAARSPTARRDR